MDVLLPSTVQELNLLQNSMDLPSPTLFSSKPINKGFENILTEKRYKREVSLPNGVENWNISNFERYLNFEDNPVLEEFKVIGSPEDRLVPEESEERERCGSFSSVSSSMDDRHMMFPSYGHPVKTFTTLCNDSGSTCISTDHSYVNNNSLQQSLFKGLDVEETYQNLDMFLQQVPEMPPLSDNLPSPLSGSSESNFELSSLHGFILPQEETSSFLTSSPSPSHRKRPLETSSEEDEVFSSFKRQGLLLHQEMAASPSTAAEEEEGYHEAGGRRKANVSSSSKSCRKTRKEKQREMEVRVTDLEKEKEELKVEVQVLEELIQAHKLQLYAILQKR